MFRNIKIKSSLYIAIGIFSLIIIAISSFSLFSIHKGNESLLKVDMIEGDQIIPIYSIYTDLLSARIVGQNIALIIESKQNMEKVGPMFDKLDSYVASAQSSMNSLRAIKPLTEQGKAIRGEIDKNYDTYLAEAIKPMSAALLKNNIDLYYDHIIPNLSVRGENFRQSVMAFSQFASNIGNSEIASANNAYSKYLIIIAISILISAVVVIALYKLIRVVILAPIDVAKSFVSVIENGDLSVKIPPQPTTEMGELLTSLNNMKDSLHGIVSNVRDAATTIATGTQQISAGNHDFSARTEEQAASIEQTAASMEELTASVKENAQNTQSVRDMTTTMASLTNKNSENVKNIINRISAIAESSGKINNIIGLMDSIAFQTNILALNAAVEAARAGEAGKGFAVVATEVRNLAQRSANSAKEIKGLIEETEHEVRRGTEVAASSGTDMELLFNEVNKVNDLIAEISLASTEQNKGIEQVNVAIVQLEQVAQQNATLVEEASSATQSLSEQAALLDNEMQFFKTSAAQAQGRQIADNSQAAG
ncbi:HAMP domain-containing protein [Affinibrenneria salicis]|uniref:HAMP domain-containing protein n=1 Tax=Affinibrenneria salicis TaxID=2590031 RepID=A0A5J5FS83_9GAMM|nr:methyl-accepting chemotaxis protein [Affinibrenneria salicis]KAA8996157.1 HAMP domain-containing protein [Affinibrenneria salicis]